MPELIAPSAADLIRDTLAFYRKAQSEIDALRAEYAPVFQLANELEGTVVAAKAAILGAMTEAGIDFAEDDSFAVSRVQPDRGAYDPAKLPPAAIAEAGTITIDRKCIERMVKRGELERAVAAAAWTPAPIAPSLRITVKTETR